uniref:UDP-glucose 4-epimerase n=1 Tax=Fasciola hepatica TaxID=6192 RepID=A0A3G0ZAV7_FASHE|nr:UDP-galactose 4'-epimerase [Fasciola hepatica]
MPGEKKQLVLVTGGTGYIGSHTVVELLEAGYDAVVLDNLSNSSIESIKRIEKMCSKSISFEKVDLVDYEAVEKVFQKYDIEYVIHFAALKSVNESVTKPLLYYDNNVTGLLNLLRVMDSHKKKNLVFSSSCTVYGDPKFLPVTEEHPIGDCINPYGASKFFAEIILKDLCRSDPEWNVVSLRYFNPIGAHASGDIGEHPNGVPSNLMPYVSQVAVGQRPHVNVFGNDYKTKDGTGVRDYIHIVDLAQAHIVSIQLLDKKCGLKVYNIGTGTGYSVLEIIKAMEKACGKPIPCKICPRREGDAAAVYADAGLAAKELKWKTKFGLDKMCEDQWRWQTKNPRGYE